MKLVMCLICRLKMATLLRIMVLPSLEHIVKLLVIHMPDNLLPAFEVVLAVAQEEVHQAWTLVVHHPETLVILDEHHRILEAEGAIHPLEHAAIEPEDDQVLMGATRETLVKVPRIGHVLVKMVVDKTKGVIVIDEVLQEL